MKSKRIDWIDCAKGITILLMILGHCVYSECLGSTLRGMIFSFHMPLFFVLSCVTYRFSTNNEELKNKTIKAFKHLIKPALIIIVLYIIWECLQDGSLISNSEYWIAKLYTFIYASGVTVRFDNMNIEPIGIPWFFFVLFIGRTIFDALHMISDTDLKLFINSCVVGCIGIIFGLLYWLPFSMDIALAIMPFFYCGYFIKKKDVTRNSFVGLIGWGVLWYITLYLTFPDYTQWTYMELTCRRYPLFPICFISAISGTMFVIKLSVLVSKLGIVTVPLRYLGKNSLYLLCIHYFDFIWEDRWLVEEKQLQSAGLRIVYDLILFVILMFFMWGIGEIITFLRSNKVETGK